ncbi:MAG: hypothetical protein M1449_11135 [Candidatus Thermoplasmatota archaeon]|nr:hypothetical protein [Candidatus Thermoplasmatota archaeon]
MRKETTERLHTLLHNKALGFAVIFGYAAVGVLIALFAPLDILAAHPWARSFVDAVGLVIPSIEKIGQFSSLSELAQFHLAVMWVLGPVLMLYIVSGVLIQRPHELRTFFLEIRRKRLIMIFVWPVVVPAIFLALFFLSLGDHPGRQLVYKHTNNGTCIMLLHIRPKTRRWPCDRPNCILPMRIAS